MLIPFVCRKYSIQKMLLNVLIPLLCRKIWVQKKLLNVLIPILCRKNSAWKMLLNVLIPFVGRKNSIQIMLLNVLITLLSGVNPIRTMLLGLTKPWKLILHILLRVLQNSASSLTIPQCTEFDSENVTSSTNTIQWVTRYILKGFFLRLSKHR